MRGRTTFKHADAIEVDAKEPRNEPFVSADNPQVCWELCGEAGYFADLSALLSFDERQILRVECSCCCNRMGAGRLPLPS